jgi:hypothetical protein
MFTNFCKKRAWRQSGDGEKQSNRVEDMMRKWLQGKSILDRHWAKAMNTTIYLSNRSPNKFVIKAHTRKLGPKRNQM